VEWFGAARVHEMKMRAQNLQRSIVDPFLRSIAEDKPRLARYSVRSWKDTRIGQHGTSLTEIARKLPAITLSPDGFVLLASNAVAPSPGVPAPQVPVPPKSQPSSEMPSTSLKPPKTVTSAMAQPTQQQRPATTSAVVTAAPDQTQKQHHQQQQQKQAVVTTVTPAQLPSEPKRRIVVPKAPRDPKKHQEVLTQIRLEREKLAREREELLHLQQRQQQQQQQIAEGIAGKKRESIDEDTERDLVEVCMLLKKKLKITDAAQSSPPSKTSTSHQADDQVEQLMKELRSLVINIPDPITSTTPATRSQPPPQPPHQQQQQRQQIVVLDTNCCVRYIADICALRTMQNVLVKVPMAVIRELDCLKCSTNTQLMHAAREITRFLFDFIREPQSNFAVQGFHEMIPLVGVRLSAV